MKKIEKMDRQKYPVARSLAVMESYFTFSLSFIAKKITEGTLAGFKREHRSVRKAHRNPSGYAEDLRRNSLYMSQEVCPGHNGGPAAPAARHSALHAQSDASTAAQTVQYPGIFL